MLLHAATIFSALPAVPGPTRYRQADPAVVRRRRLGVAICLVFFQSVLLLGYAIPM